MASRKRTNIIILENGVSLIKNKEIISEEFDFNEEELIKAINSIVGKPENNKLSAYMVFRKAVKEIAGISLFENKSDKNFLYHGKYYDIYDMDYFLRYRKYIESLPAFQKKLEKTRKKNKKIQERKLDKKILAKREIISYEIARRIKYELRKKKYLKRK